MLAEQLHLLAPTDDEPHAHRVAVLYRCIPCERRTRRAHVWRITVTSPTLAHACPTCRTPTAGQPIRGTHNAARRCDDRCMYAKGPDCVCSCGGANHGKGYALSLSLS
jgi:hypothetical protein